MARKTYAAVTEFGTMLRTTENRTYSHLVISVNDEGTDYMHPTWAGRPDLAAKQVGRVVTWNGKQYTAKAYPATQIK